MLALLPRADALGYIRSPLRGWTSSFEPAANLDKPITSSRWIADCILSRGKDAGNMLDNNPALQRDLFLLGRIIQRDEVALGQWFDERAPAVLGVLCQFLDKPAAEEVLVEVFGDIWAEAPRFTPNGTSPFSWMLQVARARAATRLRAAPAVRSSATSPA